MAPGVPSRRPYQPPYLNGNECRRRIAKKFPVGQLICAVVSVVIDYKIRINNSIIFMCTTYIIFFVFFMVKIAQSVKKTKFKYILPWYYYSFKIYCTYTYHRAITKSPSIHKSNRRIYAFHANKKSRRHSTNDTNRLPLSSHGFGWA